MVQFSLGFNGVLINVIFALCSKIILDSHLINVGKILISTQSSESPHDAWSIRYWVLQKKIYFYNVLLTLIVFDKSMIQF